MEFYSKITMQDISPKRAIEQFLCPINHSLVIEFAEDCDLINHSFRVVMLIAARLAIVSAIVAALMIPKSVTIKAIVGTKSISPP